MCRIGIYYRNLSFLNNVNIITNKVHLPEVTLARFCLSLLRPFRFLALKDFLNHFDFQSFDFERAKFYCWYFWCIIFQNQKLNRTRKYNLIWKNQFARSVLFCLCFCFIVLSILNCNFCYESWFPFRTSLDHDLSVYYFMIITVFVNHDSHLELVWIMICRCTTFVLHDNYCIYKSWFLFYQSL